MTLTQGAYPVPYFCADAGMALSSKTRECVLAGEDPAACAWGPSPLVCCDQE